ncbi:hypothetical protein BDV93DRAFT_517664 [Ceratobasidium sp. AG-I]|nr:hypothetical protein BDV93DRAFT_517664 [Ceratobasidium sp. AG-I]
MDVPFIHTGRATRLFTSCLVTNAVPVISRAERAGFGGTLHFTSPRSVTDPLPSGDLDVVLALRAQAQSAHNAQVRASTSSPYPASILSQPVTPVTTTFSGLTTSFAPTFSPIATTFSPTSPIFSQSSDHSHSHADILALAFTRSQTPTYAPSTHTTQTYNQGRSRSRSSTVTSSAPVQALKGFFSLGSGGGNGSRPPSRSASVAGGASVGGGGGKKSRARAGSSSAAGTTNTQHPQPHPYPVPIPISNWNGTSALSRTGSLAPGYGEGQSPAPTSVSFASALDPSMSDAGSQFQNGPYPHPYPYAFPHPPVPQLHPHGPVSLGTPISAGLGSMDLGDRDRDRDREREREEVGLSGLGLSLGYGGVYGGVGLPYGSNTGASLPGQGANGLPGFVVPGLPGLGVNGSPALGGKSTSGSATNKGMVTSLPPPPRTRRAGSVSHTLPGLGQGRAQEEAMGRVQEETSKARDEGMGTIRARPYTSDEAGDIEAGRTERTRPGLIPMMSLSFGQDVRGYGHSMMGTAVGGDADDDDDDDDSLGPPRERESSQRDVSQRILPPKLAPPSAPLPDPPVGSAFTQTGSRSTLPTPVPPGSWPAPSESSGSMWTGQGRTRVLYIQERSRESDKDGHHGELSRELAGCVYAPERERVARRDRAEFTVEPILRTRICIESGEREWTFGARRKWAATVSPRFIWVCICFACGLGDRRWAGSILSSVREFVPSSGWIAGQAGAEADRIVWRADAVYYFRFTSSKDQEPAVQAGSTTSCCSTAECPAPAYAFGNDLETRVACFEASDAVKTTDAFKTTNALETADTFEVWNIDLSGTGSEFWGNYERCTVTPTYFLAHQVEDVVGAITCPCICAPRASTRPQDAS